MRILYLTNIYPDIRSTKIIDSLIESGCVVDVITLGTDPRKQPPQDSTNLDLLTIGKFSKKYYLPLHPIFFKKVINFIKGKKYDFLIQRDIFQTFNAILIKKIFKINNSIIDIADNYPETTEKSFWQSLFLKRVLNKVELLSIKNNDLVLTVTDASSRFLETKHNITFNSITLHNYPSRAASINFKVKSFMPKIVYIGSYDIGIRNIEEIFKYKSEIIKEFSTFKIYIHSFDFEKIYRIAKRYNMTDYIYDGGLIEYDELHETLSNYSIGLIPHTRSNATDYTEPNKLYDYFHAYLPVLASDNPSLVDSVMKPKLGSCYINGSDFLQQLKYIESNYQKVRKNIENKKKDFIWEKDFNTVLIYINGVKS